MGEAATQMQPGQLVGPIEVPGGLSIMLLIDRRQVLTADPPDAVLSLKQLSLDFPAGTTEAKASELPANIAQYTPTLAGHGGSAPGAHPLVSGRLPQHQPEQHEQPPPQS